MFHDESTHVIKKATTTAVARRKQITRQFPLSSSSSCSAESDLPSPPPFDWADGWSENIDLAANSIAPSIQEQGIAFFFSRYVATDKGCYQNYDFIYEIWKPPSDLVNPDPITSGIIAVGLAGLSKAMGCDKMMVRARQNYGMALQCTNLALRDPSQATTDSTMLSVLLLATYEFMSGRTPQTIPAWKNHVDGAAAVASMRGCEQFATYRGVRMFILLSHAVLLSCVQSGLPMPQPIIALRQELVRMKILNASTNVVAEVICDTLQTRYDIKMGVLKDGDEIIAKLMKLEDTFRDIIDNILPATWTYRVIRLTRPHPAVLTDVCHVYPGLTEATTWNIMRSMRILIQESIIDQIRLLSPDLDCLNSKYQAIMVKSIRLIRMIGEAVVASIPQHFGIVNWESTTHEQALHQQKQQHLHQPRQPQPQAQPQQGVTPSPSPSPLPSTSSIFTTEGLYPDRHSPPLTLLDPSYCRFGSDRARFLGLVTSSDSIMWPLFTLGMSSTCSDEMREYVVDRLEAIFVETGLVQAKEVADIVKEQKREVNTWARSSMLFSVLLPAEEMPTVL